MGKKVLIVGGVAGGASTAARLRRLDENAEIIMFERGEFISFANCGLPYYVGGTIANRKSLFVQTPQSMKKRFNLDVRIFSEVIKILPSEKKVEVCNLQSGEKYFENYDYLVLSPGAQPVIPDIKGADLPNVFKVRNVPDSDSIKQYIEVNKPATAAVIGGGFIGMEMAEVLNQCGVKTTMIEASPQVMGWWLDEEMAAIIHKYLRKNGVDLFLNDAVAALEGSSRVEKVKLKSGKEISADLVIFGTGVKPEVWLAKDAGLALGSTGGIHVDEYLRTSNEFIYAVGDAIEVKNLITDNYNMLFLAGPANRQGRLAADNISGRPSRYTGALGTAIIKVIDMTAAVTGASEKSLRASGKPFLACHIHPASHATYYPGGSQMSLKLLFTPVKGKVLGAQIVGFDGVDKRIDVISTAIKAGMTVFDLMELELAYAPPFSSAKDPVNMAGYAASNILIKDIEVVYWKDVPGLVSKGAYLLDVRMPSEVAAGAVDGSVNIPVDELRNHLDEIPKDKEILVYCQVGLRSYIANRILKQKGFEVKNISGGYKSYL
jgi:NADPH-dependent 2,4-dienoyl-CoA reductase/sulfur reductase-like enzyme/rhodanese-related sulfurtransferase